MFGKFIKPLLLNKGWNFSKAYIAILLIGLLGQCLLVRMLNGIHGKNGMKKWSGGAIAKALIFMEIKIHTKSSPDIINDISPAMRVFNFS